MNSEALHTYLADQSQIPSRLGSVDCVTFIVGALKAGWGRDYSKVLGYSDRRSAIRQLRAADGLLEAARAVLGPECAIDDLPAGSVAYADVPQPTLGLVMDDWVIIKMPSQVARIERSYDLVGWRTDGGT